MNDATTNTDSAGVQVIPINIVQELWQAKAMADAILRELGKTTINLGTRAGQRNRRFIYSRIISVKEELAKVEQEVRTITAEHFSTVDLLAGDILYVNTIPGVDVVGEVKRPGRYEYQPGLTAEDYLAYAGGITRDGSRSNVIITQENGKRARGGDTDIQAGDVIYVNRYFRSIMVGGMGLVQVALTVLNMYLIAAR